MKATQTNNAPRAVGPYSQGVSTKSLVFCAGQIGIDPKTGELVRGGIIAETERVLKNLKGVLQAEKLNFSSVVMVNVYLHDMSDYTAMNEVYGTYFTDAPLPARVTVGVAALPKNARIEISCIASKT